MNVLTDWFKNRNFSAQTLMFFLFMGSFFGMPLGTAPPTICGALAAALWLFSGLAFRSQDIYIKEKWCRPVFFWMLIPWVGLLYSPDPAGIGLDYAEKIHYWIYGFALAAIVCQVNPERFIQAFLIGLALNASVGLMQIIGLWPPKNGWYSGLGRGYSTLSAYLVLGMLMSTFYFRRMKDRAQRVLLLVLAGFYFFHLIILWGRTGYVTLAILSPVIVRNLFKKFNLIYITAGCVLLAGLTLLSPVVRERVALTIDQLQYHLTVDPEKAWGKEYTAHQDRFYMWRNAVNIFLERPLLGAGTGGYTVILENRDRMRIAHPHNDFLYMAASYGILGITAFFWFFIEILKNVWPRRDSPLGYFVLSTALVILVSGLFNAQTLDAGMAFLLAVTAGLQQGFLQKKGNSSSP
jgi:O-antigen ligase